MTASRRDLLKGAVIGATAISTGGLTACAKKETAAAPASTTDGVILTEKIITDAEKVAGLNYTPAERAMMLGDLQGALETLAKVREQTIENAEAPALVFDPKLPRRPVKSQKNILILGGAYAEPPPALEADVAYASIAQLGVWLRSGSLTSARLTEIYLARIKTHDPALSAFITVTADLARKEAAEADKDFAAGKDRGPLHGVPYALKDIADTAGILTTWGAEPYQSRVPAKDAEVVRKLRNAGAVLLGKTSAGAIAYGDRWFGGVTKSPWNRLEGSSGSSAGSASATAAGLCAFAIGTETLGSIVSPSERCGTAGLRPTFGRVSRAGFMALCWSLDKVGPICRNVEDTAIVLSEINGYDADDPATARFGFTYDGKADLTAMTVGYVPAWFEDGDDADRAALEALKTLGVTLKEFPWPDVDFGPLAQIVMVEAAAAFSELTFTNRDDELGWQDKEAWPNGWRAARFFPAADYVQIDRLRRRAMEAVAKAFEGFDALIGPHYAGGALLATNATGHPQLVLRAGFSETPARTLFDAAANEGSEKFRTPRGVSLWANLFEEGKIIALGRALEQALGAVRERPKGF
ncbi:MAG: amidase [Parvularculaceae bacterium]|nr:amidase [Parvularculaceae bacterium]